MIIEDGMLRPPSPKETAARNVPLERIKISWTYDCWDDTHCRHGGKHDENTPVTTGLVDSLDASFTTLDLIEFHKAHGIPYEAHVVGNGYDGEIALDWTHVAKCKGCGQWYGKDEEHGTSDTDLHGYIIRAREAAKEIAAQSSRARRGLQ